MTPDDIVARYHGIDVVRVPVLGRRMVEGLAAGHYERAEIACGLAAIPRGARLLELGAGAGIVGAVLALNLDLAAVLSVEANPDLLPHIATLHARNGLAERIRVTHGVVLSDPAAPATVRFKLRGNFLGSGLDVPDDRAARVVEVPVLRYADLSRDFPHDAIMMDIEGGERDFLRHADLSRVEVLVAEFHKKVYGREGVHDCVRLLKAQGLRPRRELGDGGVKVFIRDRSAPVS